MTSPLSFEEATERLSPDEYRAHLASVMLSEITLESVEGTVNRSFLADAKEFDLRFGQSSRIEAGETRKPAILLDWVVTLLSGRKQVCRIKAKFRLQLSTKHDLPAEFYVIYCRLSATPQVWPFLRELIHSTTGRMGIPALTLPLLKETFSSVGAEGRGRARRKPAKNAQSEASGS